MLVKSAGVSHCALQRAGVFDTWRMMLRVLSFSDSTPQPFGLTAVTVLIVSISRR